MNISFALTTQQFRDRTKTVTRRLGWGRLKPGMILTAVEKGQGLKKGEHPVVLGKIRISAVRQERLDTLDDIKNPTYTTNELRREGFPGMRPLDFIQMFCKHNGCEPSSLVTRIEYEYL